MSYKARHSVPGLGAKAAVGARAAAITAAAAGAAGVAAMGAVPASAATAAAAATPAYSQVGTYQFASNTGQPGLAGSNDTYWQVSNSPLGYKEASQSLSSDGVDLSVAPDVPTTGSAYADSGVIVPLGTIASSGLLNSDGSLKLPDLEGSSNLQVNIYFDTNGDGKYFEFNSKGEYEGTDGDSYVTTGDNPVPASTVTADENSKQATATEIWAWVGIDSTTGGKTTTGYVSDVNDQPLTENVTGPGEIKNAYSGKCMDVTSGNYENNTKLQQWTCGAKNPSGVAGGDQQFEVVKYSNGAGALVAVDGSKQFYVVGGASGLQLTVNGEFSPNADMLKSGPYYTFPNTDTVADDAGWSTANGGKVISYTLNDGTNQQWSLP
jgi:ricin-type beta-trefoil lectin protein